MLPRRNNKDDLELAPHKLGLIPWFGPNSDACWPAAWVLVMVCVVVAAAAMVAAWRVDKNAQPCWAGRQFIDYNDDAQASLKAKTHFAAAGVQGEEDTVPSDPTTTRG